LPAILSGRKGRNTGEDFAELLDYARLTFLAEESAYFSDDFDATIARNINIMEEQK
jgi:hypothetical protein